jgi:lipopolysaccharide transport system permease protein
MVASLRSLWLYRDFIFGSVRREFQSKYRNSLLGAAWTVINPMAMIVVYTVIFSQIMQAKLPGVNHGFAYGIYLCAGSLTWGLFAEIVGRGQNIFLDNANLIKKISFPRSSLPVIAMLNAGVNFAMIFGLFLIFLSVADLWPGLVVASAIPVLLIQLIFAMGLGMTLGVLNVFFRDVGQFFGIFMQFWFWLTPVVYPADILPEHIQSLMTWNPMYPLIHAYQDIFVRAQWPVWSTMIYPLMLGLALCIFGSHLFREHVGEMVDEL